MTIMPSHRWPDEPDARAADPRHGQGRPRVRRRGLRVTLFALLCLALAGGALAVDGFLEFADRVSSMSASPAARADGIVVLTGGSERVKAGVDLLLAGHGRRLLISGVHPDTRAAQIGRITNVSPDIFTCCVDLDRVAANTIGNAAETAKWAGSNGFRSLLVVTSAYHMPRSLMELGDAMPGVRLVPYPVAPAINDLGAWYREADTLQLLVLEYVKYTASRIRLAL
ncbi:YdcF family protein [Methylobrevis pamukkalensis]|uniref:DUF218 domain-containing protein n=1 Tax=Methylobrevis pamukkalensis TaxID=1439726 RepID=A0A1E3H8J3_9HYPH|nr:YdcF family protein [Methylobrevis pamukkalensis]ODN72652.1 hypothetical protein A6302_00145 [Methylobrevis pamukkalensis]